MLTTYYCDDELLLNLLYSPPPVQTEYHFDEGSGTTITDHSGNGYTGTFGAGLGGGYYPTWVTGGVGFAGTQTIGIPNAALESAAEILFVAAPNVSNQSTQYTVIGSNDGTAEKNLGFGAGDVRPGVSSGDLYCDGGIFGGPGIQSGTVCVNISVDGHIWLNGTEVPFYNPSLQPPPLSYAGVTAARIGLTFTGPYNPYQGSLYWLVIYSAKLTPSQRAAEVSRAIAAVSGRGVPVTFSTAIPHTIILFMGDSMTRGFLASDVHLGYAQAVFPLLSGTYSMYNVAVGGSTSAAQVANFPGGLAPLLQGFGGRSVLVNMSGSNGNWGTAQTDYTALYALAKAAGVTDVIGVTGLPRFSVDTPRATFNTWLRTAIGVACDAVADWGGDATVGQAGDYTNTTYYPDGLHPSTSNHAIGAGYLKTALNALGYS